MPAAKGSVRTPLGPIYILVLCGIVDQYYQRDYNSMSKPGITWGIDDVRLCRFTNLVFAISQLNSI